MGVVKYPSNTKIIIYVFIRDITFSMNISYVTTIMGIKTPVFPSILCFFFLLFVALFLHFLPFSLLFRFIWLYIRLPLVCSKKEKNSMRQKFRISNYDLKFTKLFSIHLIGWQRKRVLCFFSPALPTLRRLNLSIEH